MDCKEFNPSLTTGHSIRERAAAEAAFVQRAARMIVDLEDTPAIVEQWRRYADSIRAAGQADPGATDGELLSAFIAVLDESLRMARADLAAVAGTLAKALEWASRSDSSVTPGTSKQTIGNFEIQRLMSAYNNAKTLLSNVEKKRACTAVVVIGKIG